MATSRSRTKHANPPRCPHLYLRLLSSSTVSGMMNRLLIDRPSFLRRAMGIREWNQGRLGF